MYALGLLEFWIAVWCLCVAAAPVAAQPTDGILVNSDIIAMNEAGLRSEFTVSRIETPNSAFDVEVDDLVRLAAAGGEDVIAAMMEAEHTVDASPPVEPETERRRRWNRRPSVAGRHERARARQLRTATRRSPMATTTQALSCTWASVIWFRSREPCVAARRGRLPLLGDGRGHRPGATRLDRPSSGTPPGR